METKRCGHEEGVTMAYAKPMRCDRNCGRWAVAEVFEQGGERHGKYCQFCAAVWVKHLNKQEAAPNGD